MKKRIWISGVFVLLIIGVFLYWRYTVKFNQRSGWNYEGQAVVLSGQTPYEFVEITDVVLDGELYGFGKYFFGDLRIGTIEAMRHYKGNPESPYYEQTGVMTPYRRALLSSGEEYFKDNNAGNRYALKVEEAATLAASDVRMITFLWEESFEYANQEGDLKLGGTRQTGRFYFRKAGKLPFVIETADYLIVPGVSTREEALRVLQENFAELGSFED